MGKGRRCGLLIISCPPLPFWTLPPIRPASFSRRESEQDRSAPNTTVTDTMQHASDEKVNKANSQLRHRSCQALPVSQVSHSACREEARRTYEGRMEPRRMNVAYRQNVGVLSCGLLGYSPVQAWEPVACRRFSVNSSYHGGQGMAEV